MQEQRTCEVWWDEKKDKPTNTLVGKCTRPAALIINDNGEFAICQECFDHCYAGSDIDYWIITVFSSSKPDQVPESLAAMLDELFVQVQKAKDTARSLVTKMNGEPGTREISMAIKELHHALVWTSHAKWERMSDEEKKAFQEQKKKRRE